MPSLSMFYGIIIYMYYKDNNQHHKPHIHAIYQDDEVIIEIPNGEILEGKIPKSKMKLLTAWVELHQDELMADWKLALDGQKPYKIEPLR
ncbi:MAG: DUF4160 domain-containing protein [Campylobacterota bacterium]|nr:DUF4160 domain-containing protein [Campylobacterota bacterium]